MPIASITTHTTSHICLVRIETETGETGWGQTAPFRAPITAEDGLLCTPYSANLSYVTLPRYTSCA